MLCHNLDAPQMVFNCILQFIYFHSLAFWKSQDHHMRIFFQIIDVSFKKGKYLNH